MEQAEADNATPRCFVDVYDCLWCWKLWICCQKHSAHEVIQAFLANWSLLAALAFYNHHYSWLNMVTPIFHGSHGFTWDISTPKTPGPRLPFQPVDLSNLILQNPWLWAWCDFPMALVGVYTWDLISYRYWSGIEFQTGLNCTKYRSNLGLHRFNVPLWGLDLTLNYTVNNIYGIMWV